MNWTWKLFNRRWHANLGIFSAITLGVIALSCFFIAHAEKGGVRKTLEQIHFGKFLPVNLRWIWIDSQGAMLLGLVVSGWFMHYKAKKKRVEESAPGAPSGSLIVLFDSRTGGAEKLARKFNTEAEARGFRAFVTDMAQYRHADLEAERWLFIITGTPAEAPANAKTFRQFVAEKKAPRLKETGFAVLAIAESADAKPGDDLDEHFAQLGAIREGDTDQAELKKEFDPVSLAARVAWIPAASGYRRAEGGAEYYRGKKLEHVAKKRVIGLPLDRYSNPSPALNRASSAWVALLGGDFTPGRVSGGTRWGFNNSGATFFGPAQFTWSPGIGAVMAGSTDPFADFGNAASTANAKLLAFGTDGRKEGGADEKTATRRTDFCADGSPRINAS